MLEKLHLLDKATQLSTPQIDEYNLFNQIYEYISGHFASMWLWSNNRDLYCRCLLQSPK